MVIAPDTRFERFPEVFRYVEALDSWIQMDGNCCYSGWTLLLLEGRS